MIRLAAHTRHMIWRVWAASSELVHLMPPMLRHDEDPDGEDDGGRGRSRRRSGVCVTKCEMGGGLALRVLCLILLGSCRPRGSPLR